MTAQLIDMPHWLEGLLPLAITLLGFVTLILLLRAVLGVNKTHEKLDEVLRELRDMRKQRPKESDPRAGGSESEGASSRGGK
jgi:hypothetical protein